MSSQVYPNASVSLVVGADIVEPGTGRTIPGNGAQEFVDPAWGAQRVIQRPLDYTLGGQLLGHYRAVAFASGINGLTAAQIVQSIRFVDPAAVGSAPSRYLVLLRYAACLEVLTAITTAPVFDLQSFVFRGSTGASSGTASTTLTLSGNNQKARVTMGSALLANGEVRTAQGAAQPLTASAGKTNDSAPFGAAVFGVLFDTSATGTAVLVSPGAAVTPGGWQDLYSLSSPYSHPIVLANNDGIETQVITANNAAGTVKYGFLLEWAEVTFF